MLNQDQIEIHVINLPQAKERKKTFLDLNQVDGVKHVFADGIDSKSLNFEELKRQNLIKPGTVFRTPGCGLAHRNLWLKSVQTYKPIIVCEDDAVLRKDFHDQFIMCMKALPHDWGFLLLGCNFDALLKIEIIAGVESFTGRFSNKKLEQSELHWFQNLNTPITALPLRNAFGTPGYALSPTGAAFLLANVFPLHNRKIKLPMQKKPFMACSIDAIMNGLYDQMKAFVCLPPMIITPNRKDPAAKIASVD